MAKKVYAGIALLDVDDESAEDGSRFVFVGQFFLSQYIDTAEKAFRDEIMRQGWVCEGLVIEVTEESVKHLKELLEQWKEYFNKNDELDRYELGKIYGMQKDLDKIVEFAKEVK